MLRKVSVKMKMLDELSEDRSKHFNKQIKSMRGLQALAGSLKGEVLDAVASIEVHSRKHRVAVKRRDLAVRLVLAFVSRSERLKLKNVKRSKAWECKHLAKLYELEYRAEVAENSLDYAEVEVASAEEKLQQILASVKSVQMRMRALVSAEKK